MGFRTRINALYASEQTVLTKAPGSPMAPGKDVHSCCRKEVEDEKGWSCYRQEMGAEEFWSAEHAEWIDEEGEEDGWGGLN